MGFLNVRNWMSQLQANAYCENPDIVLVGNKATWPTSGRFRKNRPRGWPNKYGYDSYFETSAATERRWTRMEQCVDKPPAEPANGNGATKLGDAQPNEKKCAC
uniref:Uncharacterized protein n=1 Tax=Lates calcarifer TaxID=8187 RepID=A0A4W6D2G4_LATCA